ncbi:hypothetical protein M3Y99_00086600 [Aphelenchoides fujianensis]|nr:hypothetical protein M3Y99_00086600 [Aphelenchoides fujianensis]
MEGQKTQLAEWIDENQFVTKMFVRRRMNLRPKQIEELMNGFWEAHRGGKQPLHATFIVLGESVQPDGRPLRKSLLCQAANLAAAKEKFDRVSSVNVYSLHRQPLTALQPLLNADWSREGLKWGSPVAEKKPAARARKLTEEDLFCTGSDDEVERMDAEDTIAIPSKRKQKADEAGKSKKARNVVEDDSEEEDANSKESSTSSSKSSERPQTTAGKTYTKQKVVENEVDEDGMLVTRVTDKMVVSDRPAAEPPTSRPKKLEKPAAKPKGQGAAQEPTETHRLLPQAVISRPDAPLV